jgi:tetratricopeptide (TPR) repeat protein
MTRLFLVFSLLAIASQSFGQPMPMSPTTPMKKLPGGGATPKRAPDGMPITGLSPAKVTPGLCVYSYPVSSASKECRELCDQAFGYYYSYIWMEASRSFETAVLRDPECAYAWLGLSRSLEKWGKGANPPSPTPFSAVMGGLIQGKLPDPLAKSPVEFALAKAQQFQPKASPREQLLIQARLQEKGIWPNTPPEERKKKAQASLDELLTLHEDDEEGWYWRAQVAEGVNAGVPFYKALLRMNPLHPGATHELVHFFETIKRPALGWPYAEGYIKSSPGLPHAFHMQAHLAMRIGKWQQTTDWSAKAVELEKAYHKALKVLPQEDHQFSHHMETLTRSLVHDGRFAEAKRIKAEAQGYGFNFRYEWVRMALAEKDWDEAAKIIEPLRRTDKANAAYYGALLALEKGDTSRATAEIDTLREQQQTRKTDKTLEAKLWEVQARQMCQSSQADAGLKLFKRIIDRTKDDYKHHAWGNGAVFMEAWGCAALEAGNATEAAEAFQEALAHDTGSVRGALGMWALCDRLGQTNEAERYLKVAQRCWSRADSKDFERLKNEFAERATKMPATASAAAGGQ